MVNNPLMNYTLIILYYSYIYLVYQHIGLTLTRVSDIKTEYLFGNLINFTI